MNIQGGKIYLQIATAEAALNTANGQEKKHGGRGQRDLPTGEEGKDREKEGKERNEVI